MVENDSMLNSQQPSNKWCRADFWCVSLSLVLTALILGSGISVGGFRSGDGAVHALDGVLIYDWLRAGPAAWLAPMAFAEQQYGQYPALGIGQHYPPGFAMVEAAFFAVFGVSVQTARLCVVFFGLIAAVGTYVFARGWLSRGTSVLAVVALVTMPSFVTWGRQAMLEIPTLAVLIWAGVVFSRYIQRPTWRGLLLAHAVALVAILFKQPAMFLSGAFGISVAILWRMGRVSFRHALASVAICLASVLVVFFMLDELGRQVVRGYSNHPDSAGWDGFWFYGQQMPSLVGTVLLVFAAVGLVLCFKRSVVLGVFLVGWFAACYVMLSSIDCKNPRFICIGLFPIAIWGAMTVESLRRRLPGIVSRGFAVVICVMALTWQGLSQPISLEPDYGRVVASQDDHIQGRAVLFSGIRDGDFVFAVREHLPWRSSVVVRASKLFYTCNVVPAIDFSSSVSSLDDIERILNRYSFPYIFMERANRSGVQQEGMLREYLAQSDAYRLIESSELAVSWGMKSRQRTIDVYEAVNPTAPSAHTVDIYLPQSKRTIHVNLQAYQEVPRVTDNHPG